MKNQREAAAYAIFLEDKMDEVYANLIEGISSNFELLANINPELALNVMSQLSEQITQENVEEIREHIDSGIAKMAELVVLRDE